LKAVGKIIGGGANLLHNSRLKAGKDVRSLLKNAKGEKE